MNGNDSVGQLKGVGEKTEKLYAKLGIRTVGDLVRYYPRAYDEVSAPMTVDEVVEGTICAVAGVVRQRPASYGSSRLQILSITLRGNEASLKLTWFRMPFLRSQLVPGSRFVFRGKVTRKRDGLVMEQPKIYTLGQYEGLQGTLQPIYPLTKGVTSQNLAKMIRQALDVEDVVRDWLPEELRVKNHFPSYREAMECIHFPKDKSTLTLARKRLAFDEFFAFLLKLRWIKENGQVRQNRFFFPKSDCCRRLVETLPYQLTRAQKKAVGEIWEDMRGEGMMNRLLQGDVGSGKTVVALLALIRALENGYQGVLMAPTEVLAKQHYDSISGLMSEMGLSYSCQLLTGSMTAKEKREAREAIRLGRARLVIGTHALIQDGVEYENLALVIIDEQHRFGVEQRKALTEKGDWPHVLVMSATPIPRTLALMVYGDMDLSVLDELPADRLPIKNCVVGKQYRKTAYNFMWKEIKKGRQVYVICPMVEESESIEGENVVEYAAYLKECFPPQVQVAYLHGKMTQKQKDEIMGAYADNEIQILVSTTVIEVGINVPNATVMLIENAERFGLAQLHQLRGRVGRGEHQSYCIFMAGKDNSENMERLEILNQSNDGFFVAEEDLKLRGPGDFFGMRQSGDVDFRIGDVFADGDVLKAAGEAVEALRGTDVERSFLERQEDGVIL